MWNWIRRQVEARAKRQAERKAEQERISAAFAQFSKTDSGPGYTHSTNPEAAKWRFVWRRAVTLTDHYRELGDEKLERQYANFARMASQRYWPVAPRNDYGTVSLSLPVTIRKKILKAELSKTNSAQKRSGCIYVGTDENGLRYVGQTTQVPEERWLQHRSTKSGPFKHGQHFISWEIVETGLKLGDLDSRESHFIGFLNTFRCGYNDTRGNDPLAYRNGRIDGSISGKVILGKEHGEITELKARLRELSSRQIEDILDRYDILHQPRSEKGGE